MIIKESVDRLALSKEELVYKTSGFNYPRIRSVQKIIDENLKKVKQVRINQNGSGLDISSLD